MFLESAAATVAVTTRKRKRVDENDRQTKFADPCQMRLSQSGISPTFRNCGSVRKAAAKARTAVFQEHSRASLHSLRDVAAQYGWNTLGR